MMKIALDLSPKQMNDIIYAIFDRIERSQDFQQEYKDNLASLVEIESEHEADLQTLLQILITAKKTQSKN